jgi:hypothetical protein
VLPADVAGNTYIHEKYTSVGNTYIHDKYTSAGHTKSFCLEKITIKSSFLFKRFGHKAFISVLFLQVSYKDAEIVLPIKGVPSKQHYLRMEQYYFHTNQKVDRNDIV